MFINGRYKEEETASWTVDCSDCIIEENEILLAEAEETIILTVTLDSDPTVSTTFTTQVEKGVAVTLFKESPIRVYPNPATEYLIFEAQHSGTFQLISSLGQILKTGDNTHGEERIDLSGFATGFYFLRIQNTIGSMTKKIIIQR